MNIECKVPDGVSGDWRVETFKVSKKDADWHNMRASIHGDGRFITEGTYKQLMCRGSLVMSNTPSEISDLRSIISAAKGNVLINGLGLGIVLQAVLNKEEVTKVTVIEKEMDVIRLVAPTFIEKMSWITEKQQMYVVSEDKRIRIYHDDAYTWEPPKGVRYDAVWHDIWENICADNLEGMKKLHRKYARRCDWQGSWCRYQCEHNRWCR